MAMAGTKDMREEMKRPSPLNYRQWPFHFLSHIFCTFKIQAMAGN
jgi:hypothetical protein